MADRINIPFKKENYVCPIEVNLEKEHNFAKIKKFNKPSTKKSVHTVSSARNIFYQRRKRFAEYYGKKQRRRPTNNENEVLLNLTFADLE